jgi:hypothetical protein
MSHNFWSEPDDIEPLPDWMRPNQPTRRPSKSITDIINETIRKPPVPQVPDEPTNPTE